MKYPIGVMVNSFRLPLREGLKKAAELGADGIQIAIDGEFSTELNRLERKDLLKYIKSLGLRVSAVCGDLGGHGFAIEKDNAERVAVSKRILDLALDMECGVVTTHIGVIPSDSANPRYAVMAKACEELGKYADASGARFAIETGPENPEVLRDFLDRMTTAGVGVNYDPANLAMVVRADPVKGVYTLGKRIVHTHAKDGVNLTPCDPEVVYGFFADGGIGDLRLEEIFLEKPLGTGAVDFPAWIKALEDVGYDGFLTIEREVGDNPGGDIAEAVRFLRGM